MVPLCIPAPVDCIGSHSVTCASFGRGQAGSYPSAAGWFADHDGGNEAADDEEGGDEEQEEAEEPTPEIRMQSAPYDSRFPSTNQARHCYTR